MDINEQIFLVFEGAMGFHCNRKKKGKMPFRFFKKNFGLILNSFFIFSMADDRFGVAKPYMVMRRKGCGTARTTDKEKT